MKKQIFYKLQQLKSQSSIDNSPKKNNFNREEYSYYQTKNKNIVKNNQENNINNINNITENNKKCNIPKKGKIGNLDYEIEPRNILLIPENFNRHNFKICEKELLPKEKNYFISEKNFQLIKDTLNEKEEIIKELNYLLEGMKKPNNNMNNNINSNEEMKEKISLLEEENKKLEKINNELIFQIDKKNIYFNKMYQLLKFVFKNKDSKTPEIDNFIKKQDLEILFDEELINNKNTNDKNNNDENLVDILFKTNKDMILNELENYKKKYNDIRKQLNYITNMKYNDKINENENNKIIIDYQKKINELYLSNQNYIKENTYLKLICQNIFLQKKINCLNNNDKNNFKDNEIYNKIQEKEKYINKLENMNINLEKEKDILKNKEESLLKEIEQLKIKLNKNKENEIKLKEISFNYDLIISEKEKLEKIIKDNNIKENEQKKKEIILEEEIKEIKNKNILLVNELKLEKNKIKELKSYFKNLVIENSDNIFYQSESNLYKKKIEYNKENDFYTNSNVYGNMNEPKNSEENQIFQEKIKNLDLLMLVFNKSKQLEKYINDKTNFED